MSNGEIDVWMPFFVGDYLKDTARLTTEQHGAYVLLILDYWCNGPPPNNDKILSQITNLTLPRWRLQRASIIGYFKIDGNRLVHSRIDDEIEAAKKRKVESVKKASKAAKARWNKDAPSNA
jgi:uncharacterized protein YdaU (DUF1376 family)